MNHFTLFHTLSFLISLCFRSFIYSFWDLNWFFVMTNSQLELVDIMFSQSFIYRYMHYGTKKLRSALFLLWKHDLYFISMICAKAWKKVWNLEVLREISFSLSPLKQKTWLNHFAISPYANFIGFVMSDFQRPDYKKRNLKNQDPVHSMPTNVIWKIRKKLPIIWKTWKPHWSALEWLITLSLAKIYFQEVQLDEFYENIVFFKEILQKINLKKKSKCSHSKCCIIMLKKRF